MLLTGFSTAIPVQALIVRIDLVASIESPTPQAGAMFGSSVSTSEGTVVIGELYATVDGEVRAGKAHIYDYQGNLIKTITSQLPDEEAHFGWSVACHNDIIIIGEPGYDTSGESDEGRAHIFRIITYQPVGGEILPVDKLALAAPFIALAASAIGLAALFRRKYFLHH